MKEVLFIKATLDKKIAFYHFAFFLATLPFDRIYSELALISLFIHTLVHLKTMPSPWRLRAALAPASIYLLTCVGTIYSPDLKQAFFEWEIQLAFILFPFICLFNPIDLKKYISQLLFFPALSCVITVCYLFLSAYRAILYNHLPLKSIFSYAFINQNFSLPIDLHATYFSMYIVLSVVLFIQLLVTVGNTSSRIFYSACILVLLAGLIQLSSRSALAALFIILATVVPLLILKSKYRKAYVIGALAVSAIVLFFISNNSTFHNRYVTDLKEDLAESVISNNLLEPRAVRWQCAIELIKTAPIAGYGSGSEISLLKELYFRHHFYGAYVNELNAHNEYLSIWIKTGIFGLAIYLFILLKGFTAALKERNIFFLSFMILITVVGFAENILDVNKGIFFFACLFSLFYINKPAPTEKIITL